MGLRRAAAKAEGELIRRKAADEAAELAAKEAAWRAKAKEMNAATKASNDTLLAFRAAERQRDKQLEAAVEGEVPGSSVVSCNLLLDSHWCCRPVMCHSMQSSVRCRSPNVVS